MTNPANSMDKKFPRNPFKEAIRQSVSRNPLMTSARLETTPVVKLSRRHFMGFMASATGILVVGCGTAPTENAATGGGAIAGVEPLDGSALRPGVYLGIESDGTVAIVAHRSEMGTGIRSVLPMVAADELEADWDRVDVRQAIGNTKYGDQNTDGSYSIREFYVPFRQAGATARTMLEQAAANEWGVPVAEVKAQNHAVVHEASGRSLGFGELSAKAAELDVPAPESVRLKDPSEFRYIGKEMPIVDLEEITTGAAVFGYDVDRPGMVYASVEHPPVLGGKVVSLDDSEALMVSGVTQTSQIPPFTPPHNFQPLGGVAVIADNTWAAFEGRKKLKLEWDLGENAAFSSDPYKQQLQETVRNPQKVIRTEGDVDAEFAKGGNIMEAEYYVPLLSHAPMEPPVALAEWRDGVVECWAPTQNPQAVQDTVGAALGIDPTNVICNVTLLGGAFGRKSKPDYVAEAALLSRELGRPVKVSWSREDDIKFDYYSASGAMYMKARIGDNGLPTAWLQRSAFPSMFSTFDPTATYGSAVELGMGFADTPFDIANHRVENGPALHHVRIGWLRSVANIYHAFAIQSFADEIAASQNRDRVDYLLDLIGEPRIVTPNVQSGEEFWNYGRSLEDFPISTGRLRTVLETAAERSGWANKRSGNGRGWGVAVHRSFLTYVAVVAEVEVNGREVNIGRVDLVADCGQAINPDRVRNQLEGAVVFGTSIAKMSEITAQDGRVAQANFNNYQVARITDAPREINVHIIENGNLPSGVGEPGVPPVAPAITNAVFAATGQRYRELPLKNSMA